MDEIDQGSTLGRNVLTGFSLLGLDVLVTDSRRSICDATVFGFPRDNIPNSSPSANYENKIFKVLMCLFMFLSGPETG